MTAPARWRLFVAVSIGEALRSTLTGCVATWRGRTDLAGLRWTEPDGWHVTLHFLGATDPADVAEIRRAVEDVAARHEPLDLVTGGLGGFPSPGRARVAWYGVEDPDRGLGRLAGEVRSALAPDEPGRFRAHLTLARARGAPVDLRDWISRAEPPVGRLEVDRLVLMRSHLGRGPARYESLAAARLGAAVHA